MTKAEAMRILDPETSGAALEPYRLDCDLMRAKMDEACRVAVEAMREQAPQWVSIEERLPKECENVLVLVSGLYNRTVFKRSPMLGVWFGDRGWFVDEYPLWSSPGVTHWMPLPEPPEVER